MNILQNAIDSIQIGVEDFQNNDPRRQVSALRNIVSGMLLLMKEKLCQLSPPHDPELLIKKDIELVQLPNGSLSFKGKGKRTVDVQQIQERFNSLKVKIDWKRVIEIVDLRNELEHYYSTKTLSTVNEVIAKSFLILRDFVVYELEKNPIDLFGQKCWEVLLKTNDVYEVEEAICQASFKKIDWKYKKITDALKYLSCPSCHSSLIESTDERDVYPEISLLCKSCKHGFNFQDVIEDFVSEMLFDLIHFAIKDGDELPYDTCPSCSKETYIFDEQSCVACGFNYSRCVKCEEPMGVNVHYSGGLCDSCSYRLEMKFYE